MNLLLCSFIENSTKTWSEYPKISFEFVESVKMIEHRVSVILFVNLKEKFARHLLFF